MGQENTRAKAMVLREAGIRKVASRLNTAYLPREFGPLAKPLLELRRAAFETLQLLTREIGEKLMRLAVQRETFRNLAPEVAESPTRTLTFVSSRDEELSAKNVKATLRGVFELVSQRLIAVDPMFEASFVLSYKINEVDAGNGERVIEGVLDIDGV